MGKRIDAKEKSDGLNANPNRCRREEGSDGNFRLHSAWLPLPDIARGEKPRKNVEIVRAIRTTDSRREEKLGWDQALSFGISF